MEIVEATHSDIEKIMKIIDQNKIWFKDNHINQWQDGYPDADIIKADISRHGAYKILLNNDIIGYFFLSFDGEETYEPIYNGSWTLDDKYAVIHRICLDPSFKGQGLSKKVMADIEKKVLDKSYRIIRIDTHKDNFVMLNLLKRLEYHECGIIYLRSKAQRIAFDKILKGAY